jgi:ankyrin repeat protein
MHFTTPVFLAVASDDIDVLRLLLGMDDVAAANGVDDANHDTNDDVDGDDDGDNDDDGDGDGGVVVTLSPPIPAARQTSYGDDINARVPAHDFGTALHLASERGNTAAVVALLAAGADPTARNEQKGLTPFQCARDKTTR